MKFVDSSTANLYDLNDDGWFVGSEGLSISTPVIWDQNNGQWLPLNEVVEGGEETVEESHEGHDH